MLFRKYLLRGRLEKILLYSWAGPLRGLKNLRGTEDFDKFCKNVIEKFSKIK